MTTPLQACDLATWRDVVRNNDRVSHVVLRYETAHAFIPYALVDIGLFTSTSEAKRNRPDLWCELGLDQSVLFSLKWAHVEVTRRAA